MRLYIVAVLILLSVGGVAIYYQCANNRQRETQIKQDKSATVPLSGAIHQPQTGNETNDPYDAGKDCLYRLYLMATVVGFFVALGGIYAIYDQTKATRDAAIATMRSVELQEKANKQWVNLDGWEVFRGGAPHVFNIAFKIVNPTKVPLTLHRIHTSISGQKAEQNSVNILAPDNPYVLATRCELSDVQWNLYASTQQVDLPITCAIIFTDCFGMQWEQCFERELSFGSHGRPSISIIKNDLRKYTTPRETK